MKGLIFTYVVAYGGAVAALFNPFYGLLGFTCFAIIKPERHWHSSVPIGNYSLILAVAMLIGWAIRGFGNRDFRRGWPIVICGLAFFLCAVASASLAPNKEVANHFVELMFKILLPCLVGATIIETPRQLNQFVWVIVFSLGFLAFEENVSYYRYGILPDQTSNPLAHMMALGAGVAFVNGYYSRKLWQMLLSWFAAALMAHTVMIHMSRGAMLGMAVVGVGTLFLLPKNRKTLVVVALALVAGGILAGPSVQQEFATIFADDEERDASAESRFRLWNDMFDAGKRNPLFGIGPDHWPLIAHQYGYRKGKEGHGLWQQMGCEVGFPGGIFYFLGYFLLLPICWRAWRVTDTVHGELAPYLIIALACVSGHLVEASFGSFEAMELPYFLAMIGVVALKQHQQDKAPRPHHVGQVPQESYGHRVYPMVEENSIPR